MPCRLIINADDFGLTRGVNRAIAELHQAGALTSATLMANGGAFGDAVAVAHENPSLGVGCHVVLTAGLPVSDPASIPSLLGPDGKHLRPTLGGFVQALLLGRISEEEIAREAQAQIDKLRRAGVNPTHIDTHKHTHMFPQVVRPLLRAADTSGIRAIRNPFEATFARGLGHGPIARRAQVALLSRFSRSFYAQPQIRIGSAQTTDGSLCISTTGELNPVTLNEILKVLPDGTWELVCHPGFHDADLDAATTRLRGHRKIEYGALLSNIPKRLAQPNPPQLIHYGDLSNLTDVSS